MLDWGGSTGHSYLLAQALLPDVRLLAQYGAQLFPGQHFYGDESCLERSYDFVMASSSLHYSEDWQRLLAGLARAPGEYI